MLFKKMKINSNKMLIFHKIKANNRINFHFPLLDETSTVFLDMKANMPHDFTHEIESNCDNKQISRSQRLMPVFFARFGNKLP